MNRLLRRTAAGILVLISGLALYPGIVVSDSYEEQFRERIDEPPSMRFPLGTDGLGRNRLSRLLYGTRTSLVLAPAAAMVCVALAVAAGLLAVSGGRFANRVFEFGVDLMASLPWLFVLIGLRAALPLDVSPAAATGATFTLLALLGWAAPARLFRNWAASARQEDWWLQAEASGVRRGRLWLHYLAPAMWPLAATQVWISIPVFVLSEANLGLLGLGVAEPTPSLGNLMRELENVANVPRQPWLLAPVVVLAATTLCLYVVARTREVKC